MSDKLTYEEFRKDWFEKCEESISQVKPLGITENIKEYFCQCDYKRYTGEWQETL